uniref:Uncharacterized protein n=1 Tax=Triticum urartu TaxID=4572 RepID=A0A8R7UTD0_TRIUA
MHSNFELIGPHNPNNIGSSTLNTCTRTPTPIQPRYIDLA